MHEGPYRHDKCSTMRPWRPDFGSLQKRKRSSHENRSILKKRKCWPVKRQKGMRVKMAAKRSRVLSLSSISWAVRGRGWVDAVKVGAVPWGRIRTPTVRCSPAIVSLLVARKMQVWHSKNACHEDFSHKADYKLRAFASQESPLSLNCLYC